MGPVKNQSLSERRKRRKAIIAWTLAVALWAVFAVKESETKPKLPKADASVMSIVLKHLDHESHNPLFGNTNISVSKDDK
ncbi:hypothetical protein LLG46_10115 [bacterium]|nr:hypothetical protein [bacterium]